MDLSFAKVAENLECEGKCGVPASYFCNCSLSPQIFCGDCIISKHVALLPDDSHSVQLISQEFEKSSKKSVKSAKRRKNIQEVRTFLENIKYAISNSIDLASSQAELFDQFTQQMFSEFRTKIRSMQETLFNNIGKLFETLKKAPYVDADLLPELLDSCIRVDTVSNINLDSIVSQLQNALDSALSKIQLTVDLNKITDEMPVRNKLVHLDGTLKAFSIYDCRQRSFTKSFKAPSQFSNLMATNYIIPAGSDDMYLCGDFPPSATLVKFVIDTEWVDELGQLGIPRSDPGLALINTSQMQRVYIIGGTGSGQKPLSSIEQYDFNSEKLNYVSQTLPMACCQVSAVTFGNSILITSTKINTIYHFSVETEQIQPLLTSEFIQNPLNIYLHPPENKSFRTLSVFTSKQLVTLRLENGQAEIQKLTNSNISKLWARGQVVCYNDYAYLMHRNGEVSCIELPFEPV